MGLNWEQKEIESYAFHDRPTHLDKSRREKAQQVFELLPFPDQSGVNDTSKSRGAKRFENHIGSV
jgi:hypothetical protein